MHYVLSVNVVMKNLQFLGPTVLVTAHFFRPKQTYKHISYLYTTDVI